MKIFEFKFYEQVFLLFYSIFFIVFQVPYVNGKMNDDPHSGIFFNQLLILLVQILLAP